MFRFTCLFAASAQTIDLTITPNDDAFNVAFTPPADMTWCAVGSQDDVTKQMEGLKGHIFKLDDKVSPDSATRFTGEFTGDKKVGQPQYNTDFESHVLALGYNQEKNRITAALKKEAKNVAYACGTGDVFPPTKAHSAAGLKALEQDSQPEGEPETETGNDTESEPEAGGDSDDSDSAAGAVSVMMIFATLL